MIERYVVLRERTGFTKRVLTCVLNETEKKLYTPYFIEEGITPEHAVHVDYDKEIYIFRDYPSAFDFLKKACMDDEDYFQFLADPHLNPLPFEVWAMLREEKYNA